MELLSEINPALLTQKHPTHWKVFANLLLAISATILGILLSLHASWFVWLLGQLVLGLSIVQWFSLLHEFGHQSYFKSPRINYFAGLVASAIVILPFASWKFIHAQHHIWTGWKDLDPTMNNLLVRPSPLRRKLTATAWKYWIPVLTLGFALANFWNVPRLFRIFPQPKQRLECVMSIGFLVILYAILIWQFPIFWKIWLFAYLIFLSISDPLLISQHAYVSQKLAGELKVRPFSGAKQSDFTRSLEFPRWFANWVLFNFNCHGLHHRFPYLPGFSFSQSTLRPGRSLNWLAWLRAAKHLPGDVLIFEDETSTGKKL